MKRRILSLLLCALTLFSACSGLVSCGKGNKNDALVIMTEALDGLFNPFFSTSANDSTIVGMTQIGMLSSKYVNGSVEVAYGDNEAVVVKDYGYKNENGESEYTFVLKNGIKYSDGHPLTMEDVMFNLYVYLDPVYTGSSTMYSTKIQGLYNYRTQTFNSNTDDSDNPIDTQAAGRAEDRINELRNLFLQISNDGKNLVDYNTMKQAILDSSPSPFYKKAISNNPDEVTSANLLADYENTLKKFKEELESDYVGAQDSYTEEPYKSREEFKDPILCFMYTEGYVTIKWAKDPVTNVEDKSKIESIEIGYTQDAIKTKEDAINRVYNDKTGSELHLILDYWATGQELRTDYTAKAKEVILHENLVDGQLNVDHIEGIVSLGHNAATKGTTITVNGNSYKVASEHNSDGTPKNADEYDVLRITIDGVDPKAIWNFAFTVAPQHYYGEGSKVGVDLENNKFGVEFGSFGFMQDIIQSTRNIKLPMGAGAYKVTNRANDDNPAAADFYKDNVVHFKRNDYFETVGSGLSNAKIEKIRYQVVSASNAIGALESGDVHYVTPQLTNENFDKLNALGSKGVKYTLTDQLGYGYIGINATKVPDLNIRKAIMTAMNTALAIDYYRPGTASQIYWPMSTVSWAYPKENGLPSTDNEMPYPQKKFDTEAAKEAIQDLMAEAGVAAGNKALEITFTIAGSNLQDHPTYKTFRDAAALLNSLGWKVDVKPDTQALTKINTGSLEVWAAAWGSALDPDMYQVYHKNSTATSTLAWGYPQLKKGSQEEIDLLNELSDLIDDARETDVQSERAEIYKEAMKKVLGLAIELPVYQRSVVYAYNTKVLNPDSLPKETNPYSSPLDRIWEIEFAK